MAPIPVLRRACPKNFRSRPTRCVLLLFVPRCLLLLCVNPTKNHGKNIQRCRLEMETLPHKGPLLLDHLSPDPLPSVKCRNRPRRTRGNQSMCLLSSF